MLRPPRTRSRAASRYGPMGKVRPASATSAWEVTQTGVWAEVREYWMLPPGASSAFR